VVGRDGHTGTVTSAVLSPDGTRIVTSSDDGTAQVWDPDGTSVATLTGHDSAVYWLVGFERG
jgi:WD40 repeat protein